MATKLKVVDRVEETSDSVSLYFKKPFFGGYSYKSGQFLTLKFNINGENQQRAYSLNSTPGLDKLLSVTIKKVDGGLISNHIFSNVKVGDKVDTIKPMGGFVLSGNNPGHYILFGAGSGITPLFSMAKYILHNQTNTKVTLVYANQNEKTIIFKKKLDSLQHSFGDRFTVQHYLTSPINGWGGYTGQITATRVGEALENVSITDLDDCEFYMCGPTGFMDNICNGLVLKGVKSSKVFKESFVPTKKEEVDTSTLDFDAQTIKVLLNRQEYGIHIPKNKTILDAALDNKIKIPFSCGSGSCASCLCKVKHGDVRMIGAHCLTEKDIKKGYVLACCSYAASEEIVLQVE